MSDRVVVSDDRTAPESVRFIFLSTNVRTSRLQNLRKKDGRNGNLCLLYRCCTIRCI